MAVLLKAHLLELLLQDNGYEFLFSLFLPERILFLVVFEVRFQASVLATLILSFITSPCIPVSLRSKALVDG